MTSILCLAHYCDLHGPTPLMVTEGFPVLCTKCNDDSTEPEHPSSATTTPPSVADAFHSLKLSSARSSSVPASEEEAQAHRAAVRRASKLATASSKTQAVTSASPTAASSIETPPQSPRRAPDRDPAEFNASAGGPRRDSSFRRTYDDYVTRRANPCKNCALTLPKRQQSPGGADHVSRSPDFDTELREPKLRTRTPYAHVYGTREHSPPTSNPESSCTSDAECEDLPRKDHTRQGCLRRPTTSTSHSSLSSRSTPSTHRHFLDYTSTHEPQEANTYALLRASCLRTLSFEMTPRRPEHGSNSSSAMHSPTSSMTPTIPPSYPSPPSSLSSSFAGLPTAPQSAAGGPIFFGDPVAGYTTAYIFRIPDMHARGRKRVYAFMALSTHRERLAMKAFGFLAVAFRDLADWIQDLVEAEAEREREREEESGLSQGGPYAGPYERNPRDSGVGLGLGGGSLERDRDSGSSFLTGGGRRGLTQRMGGSMGPGGFAPKARGLAELSGMPDFFIQLHTRFVQLLLDLGMVLA